MCGGEVGEILGSQLSDDLRKWISFVWILVLCGLFLWAVDSGLCHHTVLVLSRAGTQILSTHTVQRQQGVGDEQGPTCDYVQRVQGATTYAWGT